MRRTGRTTRIVDGAIQKLFKEGKICLRGANINVFDHLWEEDVPDLNKDRSQRHLFIKIMERLHNEHKGQHYDVDGQRLTIKLLN